jgi:uncharacterized membrane protein
MAMRRWYSPRSIARSILIRPRLYLAAFAGAAVLVLAPASMSANVRGVLAWDVSAFVYLVTVLRVMMKSNSEMIRVRAARQDDGGQAILIILLLAITASFAAIAGLLSEAKASAHDLRLLHLVLAASTILMSWAVTQVVFTLHYAHEYYRPSGGQRSVNGLDFPGDGNPDYWDFLYFATSIGAASQTSDVAVRTKTFRRLVTVHAIISFFFNTAVLALTINLAAGVA